MFSTKRTLLVFGLVLATAGQAQAADRCTVFEGTNRTGNWDQINLPAVEATRSPDAWGNTSTRELDYYWMPGAASVEIVAKESDVALYMYTGVNFTGVGTVLHCKKAHTCSIATLSSRVRSKIRSISCSREYFRRAFPEAPSPWAEGDGPLLAKGANPIIDMATISTQFDQTAKSKFEGQVDAFRPTTSVDGRSLYLARTTWLTKTNSPYRDMVRINKRFEIDIDNFWADIGPGVDDDYVVELTWDLRPVMNSSSQLHFWYSSRSIWVEEGALHQEVLDNVTAEVAKVNIQEEVRNGVASAFAAAGCPGCMDNKQRLQLSYFTESNVGKNVWTENFDTVTTHPKLVLAVARNAIYPE